MLAQLETASGEKFQIFTEVTGKKDYRGVEIIKISLVKKRLKSHPDFIVYLSFNANGDVGLSTWENDLDGQCYIGNKDAIFSYSKPEGSMYYGIACPDLTKNQKALIVEYMCAVAEFCAIEYKELAKEKKDYYDAVRNRVEADYIASLERFYQAIKDGKTPDSSDASNVETLSLRYK